VSCHSPRGTILFPFSCAILSRAHLIESDLLGRSKLNRKFYAMINFFSRFLFLERLSRASASISSAQSYVLRPHANNNNNALKVTRYIMEIEINPYPRSYPNVFSLQAIVYRIERQRREIKFCCLRTNFARSVFEVAREGA
jgi:hypothetical protein